MKIHLFLFLIVKRPLIFVTIKQKFLKKVQDQKQQSEEFQINKFLYISYDGLHDNLGHSQIIPYIKIINKNLNNKFYVISFEKKKNINKTDDLFKDYNIEWIKLSFTKNIFPLIKILDLIKLISKSIYIVYKYKIQIVHCRGHVSALSGLICKLIFKTKFIFDCRSFWVDERFDDGKWNKSKYVNKIAYFFFKYLEKKFFKNSDHSIILTNKAKEYLISNKSCDPNLISVIPCCADYDKFNIYDSDLIDKIKNQYGINKNDIVFGYFGSLSPLYMTDKMINFFKIFKKSFKNSKFMVFTDNNDFFNSNIDLKKFLLEKSLIVKTLNKEEIPSHYNICNFTLSFISNSKARIATSPTKIAESLACGIPVICNQNIGDLDSFISKYYDFGLINANNDNNFHTVISNIQYIISLSKDKIRNLSKLDLDLNIAKKKYIHVYKSLINEKD